MTDLTGKRVLILGAEIDIGRSVTTAIAEAGGSVAAVAATNDAEAAFAVQRLARRLSSDERKVIAQAIDATNEAAVRVMVRQVSKGLGGLDAIVWLQPSFKPALSGSIEDPRAREQLLRELETSAQEHGQSVLSTLSNVSAYGGRELDRLGGGPIVVVSESSGFATFGHAGSPVPKWWMDQMATSGESETRVVEDVLYAIIKRDPRRGLA